MFYYLRCLSLESLRLCSVAFLLQVWNFSKHDVLIENGVYCIGFLRKICKMQTSSGVCGGIVAELLRLGLLHRKSKGWVIHTKSDWLCSVKYERGQVRPGCSLGSHCNLIPAMQSSSKNTCLTSK